MSIRIEVAEGIGFCSGVKRTIILLEKAARKQANIQTLGAVVHNKGVLEHLAAKGITSVEDVEEVTAGTAAIGAHGVGPGTAAALKVRASTVIDTTCPDVRRVQQLAQRLAGEGYFVIVFGDANHAEVKGILGHTQGKGMATRDAAQVARLSPVPKRIAAISQTTNTADEFKGFVKALFDATFDRDSELLVADTICRNLRGRQEASRKLAEKVDLMVVVGDRTSANTNRLAEMCARSTETRMVETASDIRPGWLKGHTRIGVTGGASTPEEDIQAVVGRLEKLTARSADSP
jgi:4-hydroxy-3-methylbut-2-enyl diphosphate reductase